MISHKMLDGGEKPVAFVLRMLTKAEKKYSQIGKEALDLVFGVMKFHEYVFGHKFTLIADHKNYRAGYCQSHMTERDPRFYPHFFHLLITFLNFLWFPQSTTVKNFSLLFMQTLFAAVCLNLK